MNNIRKRKGDFDLNMVLILELIIFIVASMVVINVIRSFDYPHKQTAFANVESLRQSINRACITSDPVTIQDFHLDQPTPMDFWGLYPELAAIMIKTIGDPHYIIYYESFPPGEAVGWETYIKAENRLSAPLDPARVNNMEVNRLASYVKSVKEQYSTSTEPIDQVLIPNLMLTDISKRRDEPAKNTQPAPDDGNSVLQGNGVWEDNLPMYSLYKFENYFNLSPFDKTKIKYRTCGPNSLCLKTKEGVYAFPLTSCQGQINYIQLVYDSKMSTDEYVNYMKTFGVEIAMITLGPIKAIKFIKISTKLRSISSLLGLGGIIETYSALKQRLMASFKVSDFYIASPCELTGKIKIEKISDCRLQTSMSDFYFCKHMVKYPIYDVKDDKIVQKTSKDSNGIDQPAYHYQCLDDIGDIDKVPQDRFISEPVPCVRITYGTDHNMKNKFCWTSNTRKAAEAYEAIHSTYAGSSPITRDQTNKADKESGADPVTYSTTAYPANPNNVMMKNYEVQSKLREAWKNMIGGYQWSWPGNDNRNIVQTTAQQGGP